MPLGTKVGLVPGHGDPAPPKGLQPQLLAMSVVAKRSPISATAEHLLSNYFDHLFGSLQAY